MLTLFPDEQVLTQSSEGTVTLTTHRICYEYTNFGNSYNQTIMLENITSCENKYTAQVWLLIVGGFFLFGGLLGAANNSLKTFGSASLIAILCGSIYLLTRRNFIIIASASTKMLIKVTGMKQEQILKFINNVEQAKNKRIITLNNRGGF